MERVHSSSLDGATGGHQGLGGNLTPEGALAGVIGVTSPKDIDLNGFEVE
jgi:hypothetical protein